MDINEALNQIIFKYHLDRYYPHYRNMYEAEKILRYIIETIIQFNKKAIFIGNDETEIKLLHNISRDYRNIDYLTLKREDKSLEQLNVVMWQDYEEIYLTSFYGAAFVERWFRQHEIKYEWIYDIFERKGLFLQRAFYALGKEDLYSLIVPDYEHISGDGWTESFQCELYYHYSKYENTVDAKTKLIALERCLFLSLYMRNFTSAQRFLSLLIKESEEKVRFECLWEDIKNLLDDIKRQVHNRNEKDIIVYWIDALPYGDEKDMPYLQSVLDNSVIFENAFTYIANTRPTLRAMFLELKDIDDQAYHITKITRDNSPILKFLESQGYGMKAFTGYFNENLSFQYLPDCFYIDIYETFSMKLWDMLSCMLLNEKKTLWIIHAMDAHPPCLNTRLCDSNSNKSDERYRLSRMEVDEQLAFYDPFFHEEAYRIFMSDHGRKAGTVHTDQKLRFHILFDIYHKTLKPRTIKGLFSLLDFATVLKQIILYGDIIESEISKEYIEIGCMDLYNYTLVENVFRKKMPLSMSCFGYKGIVDKEYIYIHYKIGKEWLQRRDNIPELNPRLFYDFESDICDPTRLPYYRKLAGGWPENFDTDEQFKYSKYLYSVYHNVLKHNFVKEYMNMISEMLAGYTVNSVGIRMGGIHSKILYSFLSIEDRKKIWGFIDNNANCECSEYKLPIVNDRQFLEIQERNTIKAVLLSSYNYLGMLRKEAETYSERIDILDIYALFEKRGKMCRENFWEIKIDDEDYNVGFPFKG